MQDERSGETGFEAFVRSAEPRLRHALVAAYGPDLGRNAALDALSWAWEHWDRVQGMANPIGYLYRVGQTAARRAQPRAVPFLPTVAQPGLPDVEPGLVGALGRLSEQQRAAVVLVHAFGWTIREAADLVGVGPSTLQTHLARGMARLRSILEVHGDD